jgi:1-acyl-sn-glycerol-3-phosphate acyltransferase
VKRFAEWIAYPVVRFVLVGFSYLFWRVTVDGREHIPKTGSFILAPVHRSNVDSPVVAAVTRRRMRYLGKQEMWKYRAPAAVFNAMRGIPVNRGTPDRDALRRCVTALQAGEPLVVFPAGSRRSGPLVDDLFEGVAYLATKTGAPIIPVGIGGSEQAMPKGAKFIHPVKIRLVVGPPIRPEVSETGKTPRRAVRELNDRLHAELQRLFDEAQAKVGRPNELSAPPAAEPS